jgi:hypothetical protein
MKTNNTIEDEIDAIRDKICEEIKDMTPSEINEYFNRETEKTIKKYGLKTVKFVQSIPIRNP